MIDHQRAEIGDRWISLLEVLAASAIVVGYNVFHVLPNSVFLLCAMALVSFRLREGSWAAIGLQMPKSWLRTAVIALAAAIVQQLVGQFVVDPLIQPYFRFSAAANPMEDAHNSFAILRWLGIVWTYAAFGEEIAYRGYMLNRVADLGGRSRAALVLGLLWSSVLFGFAHWYQGPAGVIGIAVSGLIYGAAYLLAERNLWAAILAHGISDTLALLATVLSSSA